MRHRFLGSIGALAVIAVVSLAPVNAAGQAPKAAPAADNKTPQSRTPWGDPDLQGVYTFSTLTPVERPREFAEKDTLTEAELAALEKKNAIRIITDSELPAGETGAYNAFWTSNEKGRLTGHTSLIVDPENGRQPPLTAAAQKAQENFLTETASRIRGVKPYQHLLINKPADFDEFTRCLARPMPRIGQSYNHGIQVLQTPGYVVIDYESMHDVRIIPLDRRPHLDQQISLWNGDSRGHWEGQTLVVEVTNFTNKTLFADYRGFDGIFKNSGTRLTERFTRVDANTINYEVTVDDPATWTKPWTFILPWRSDDPNYKNPEDLYEYACHEGNFRMVEDALLGSRVIEQTVK